MSFFDRFKKTKKEPEKKAVKKEVQKPKEKKEKPKVVKAEQQEPMQKLSKRVEKKQFSEAWHILQSPHVTEKSGMLAEKNHYVFKVSSSANKQQIKKAVEDLYGVAVEKVAVVNIPKKARKLGKSQGFKSGYRKAMVKLAPGEKIEIMPR